MLTEEEWQARQASKASKATLGQGQWSECSQVEVSCRRVMTSSIAMSTRELRDTMEEFANESGQGSGENFRKYARTMTVDERVAVRKKPSRDRREETTGNDTAEGKKGCARRLIIPRYNVDAGGEDCDAIFNSGHGIAEAKVSEKKPRGKCEVQLKSASRAKSVTLRSATIHKEWG